MYHIKHKITHYRSGLTSFCQITVCVCVYMLQIFCEMSYPKQTTCTAQRKCSGKPKGGRFQKGGIGRPGRAKAQGNGRCMVGRCDPQTKRFCWFEDLSSSGFQTYLFEHKVLCSDECCPKHKTNSTEEAELSRSRGWNPRLQGLSKALAMGIA